MNPLLESSFVSAEPHPKQWRGVVPVPTPSSVSAPLPFGCPSPAWGRLTPPLHPAAPLKLRWIFLPSGFSLVTQKMHSIKRDSAEPKKQNRFGAFVEDSGMISKPGPQKAHMPGEVQGRAPPPPPASPGPCTAHELHAGAKVRGALANLPRSFLPCAGPDPAAPSQEWEDGWEPRRGSHRSWSQSPSRAWCTPWQRPPC